MSMCGIVALLFAEDRDDGRASALELAARCGLAVAHRYIEDYDLPSHEHERENVNEIVLALYGNCSSASAASAVACVSKNMMPLLPDNTTCAICATSSF